MQTTPTHPSRPTLEPSLCLGFRAITIPTIDWTDLVTHQDHALLRAEMAELRADFRVELGARENRLQRSMVTWILAAQGVALATLGALVTVLTPSPDHLTGRTYGPRP